MKTSYRRSWKPKVYRSSWLYIFFLALLVAVDLLVPYKPIAFGMFLGVNLAQWAFRLLFAVPLIFFIVYLLKRRLILKSDRLVIGAFKKREILFSEIVAMEEGTYKGGKWANFSLRNGQSFDIDYMMSGYQEALETIRGSMS
ncbi:hypothetical protein [Dyella sp. 20L07]|uniref:hypothetical protein n=1 Tax=Dyella sp. 20L07 TaxID=3384240 RepID=UPI003D2715BA